MNACWRRFIFLCHTPTSHDWALDDWHRAALLRKLSQCERLNWPNAGFIYSFIDCFTKKDKRRILKKRTHSMLFTTQKCLKSTKNVPLERFIGVSSLKTECSSRQSSYQNCIVSPLLTEAGFFHVNVNFFHSWRELCVIPSPWKKGREILWKIYSVFNTYGGTLDEMCVHWKIHERADRLSSIRFSTLDVDTFQRFLGFDVN